MRALKSKNQRGSLLIIAIFLITVVAAMGIAVTSLFSNTSRGGFDTDRSTQGMSYNRYGALDNPGVISPEESNYAYDATAPVAPGDAPISPSDPSVVAFTDQLWNFKGGGDNHAALSDDGTTVAFGAAGTSSNHTTKEALTLCNVDGQQVFLGFAWEVKIKEKGNGKKIPKLSLTIEVTGTDANLPKSFTIADQEDGASGTFSESLGVFNPANAGVNVSISVTGEDAGGVKDNDFIVKNLFIGPTGGCSEGATMIQTITDIEGNVSLIVGDTEESNQTYSAVAACAWIDRPFLVGRSAYDQFRAFFRFQIYRGDVTEGGFTLTLLPQNQSIQNNDGSHICGSAGTNGQNLGYLGLADSTEGKIAIEFDLHSLGNNDPAGNHVALLVGNSVTHGSGATPACASSNGTDCLIGNTAWLETETTNIPDEYSARVELLRETGCSHNGTTGDARITVAVCSPGGTCQASDSVFSNLRIPYSGGNTGVTQFSRCLTLPSGADFSAVRPGFTVGFGQESFALVISEMKLTPPAHTVSHWPFNPNNRGSGTAVSATFSDDVPTIETGESLAGGYFQLDNSGLLTIDTDDFTLMAWVKLPASNSTQRVLLGKGGIDDPGYSLYLDTQDYVVFQVRASDGIVRSIRSQRPLTTGQWEHVAAVLERDASTTWQMRLYHNAERQALGVRVNQNVDLLSKSLAGASIFAIGGYHNGVTTAYAAFPGLLIDEVWFYPDIVLTDGNIINRYNTQQ
ncbi:LamG-like jellyroll fold domain-containing protein [Chrysiogenes arsenatis]|uniref:LamG-like jellyroll fold domain-containing protein n=1 Tax=Chrysiogenes arsenatis TaxID=309797 RepID=UPI0003FC978C|nr:LamG-like jellyroll fold domain-containing protein [Chrysiogenes arsenatis]